MSWTFAEERPIYWEEPPDQIAITNVGTGECDFYMLTSAAAEQIRGLRDENVRLRSCLSDTEEHASAFMWEAKQLEEERDKLRELVRCLVCSENPSERAALITNAAEMLAELGVEI